MSNRRRKPSKSYAKTRVLHILSVVGVTLLFVVILAFAAVFLLFRGPSSSAKSEAVPTFHEMSAMKWVPYLFLPSDEVDSILEAGKMVEVAEGTVADLDKIDTSAEKAAEQPDIEVLDVKGSSYKGKLMIIKDPSKVFLGTVPEFYHGDGENVATMMQRYPGTIAGVNGGDFIDLGTNNSFTAQPLGAVISNGQIVYDEYEDGRSYHLTGFTNDNKFFIGQITLDEAVEMGVRDAVYTVHETGPFLVLNGDPLINEVPNAATYGGGKNPRTAIGQRADGSILLLVIDGRQAASLGATFKDLAYIMLEYGAVNAAAMDGGTSSQMVYQGSVINNPYSPTGPRRCPTAWLVYE